MTRKVYKSAMGKTVDLGALLLQNEQVRAVGNMGVNAAGDLIDGNNRVIDQRNRQVQKQYRRQTNVSATPVATSNLSARKAQEIKNTPKESQSDVESEIDTIDLSMDQPAVAPISEPTPVDTTPQVGSGGLAAAIARSREIKQELEKTRRQQAQEQGIKKI